MQASQHEPQIIETLLMLTQPHTQHIRNAESILKSYSLNQRKMGAMLGLLVKEQTEHHLRVLIVSALNLVVQEILNEYLRIVRNREPGAYSERTQAEIRRYILNINNKIEAGVDSKHVPAPLKPRLVHLHFKLYTKQKQQYDHQRVLSKMQYYLRKELTTIAVAYLHQILSFRITLKQRLQTLHKFMCYLPPICHSLFKSLLVHPTPQIYASFGTVWQQLATCMQSLPVELSPTYIVEWANNSQLLQLFIIVNQQLLLTDKGMHPQEQLEKWQQSGLRALCVMARDVQYGGLVAQCGRFMVSVEEIVREHFVKVYAVSMRQHVREFTATVQPYMGLYTLMAGLRLLPRDLYGGYEEGEDLGQRGVAFVMEVYVGRLVEFVVDRVQYALSAANQQDIQQCVQLLTSSTPTQLTSLEQIQQSTLSTLVLQLLSIHPSLALSLQHATAALLDHPSAPPLAPPLALLPIHEQPIIGMVLLIVGEPHWRNHPHFVSEVVGGFVERVVAGGQVLRDRGGVLMLFLAVLGRYIDELELWAGDWKYGGFFTGLAQTLLAGQLPGALEQLGVDALSKYIHSCQAIHCNSSSPPLAPPLQLPPLLPTTLSLAYESLLLYPIFALPHQPLPQTNTRLQQLLTSIISSLPDTIYQHHCLLRVLGTVFKCRQYRETWLWMIGWAVGVMRRGGEMVEGAVEWGLAVLGEAEEGRRRRGKVAGQRQFSCEELANVWMVAMKAVSYYQFTQVNALNDDMDDNNYETQLLQTHKPSKQTTNLFQLMQLSICYQCPAQLVTLVFDTACSTLRTINHSLSNVYRKKRSFKSKPYIFQEMSFLIILHGIIVHQHRLLTDERIEQLIRLYKTNVAFRQQFPEDLRLVHGKYNLIIVLLLRYRLTELPQVLRCQDQFSHIYRQVFLFQQQYLALYDSPLLINTAFQLLGLILDTPQQTLHILPHAHLILAAAVLNIDRLLELYRRDKYEDIDVPALHNMTRNSIIFSYDMMSWVVGLYRVEEVDELACLRAWHDRVLGTRAQGWFQQVMECHVKLHAHNPAYKEFLWTRKVVNSRGDIIYRVVKPININLN